MILSDILNTNSERATVLKSTNITFPLLSFCFQFLICYIKVPKSKIK